jgi:serine protease Do
MDIKGFVLGLGVGLVLLGFALSGAVVDRLVGIKVLDNFLPKKIGSLNIGTNSTQNIVKEESVVIDVAKKVSPSVVTVSIKTPQKTVLQFSPFGGFSQGVQGGQEQDIGTGFILSSDGLIVTNKHVVSTTDTTYKIVTKDDKQYDVKQISRDPNNDIAILKVDANDLTPIELGDSTNLEVGQFVIAIGTALGEFRDTVTTGVISGLGRGITAGSAFEGYVEQLDNVIQTDAAINPGNSGGPLLNSSGQAIGINVAIAQGAQNVGFAIPINVVKDSFNQFKTTGKFPAKAFLGVRYQLVSQRSAILNQVPQGVYVYDVVAGSPAEEAGVKVDDIITKIDGQELSDENTLSSIISKKKPGDKVDLEIYRDGQTQNITATLAEAQQ